MGPAFDDVAAIRSVSPADIEFTLRHRSTFLLEALGETAIRDPSQAALSGTGPFSVTKDTGSEIEMTANQRHYGGKPAIDRIVIKPFTSLRSAWAEMLRGHVDMLYDVGVDALDSLASSSEVNTFTFQRGGYAYLMLLNVTRPPLNDAAFRRTLNGAIDRQVLLDEVWSGLGAPADSPVWYRHWAYQPELPRFVYHPVPVPGAGVQRFKCLIVDPSHERLALLLQRQLQAIDVEVEFEFVPLDQGAARVRRGDFDAILVDYLQGPNMIRPYLTWYSRAPSNLGHYSNKDVDAAFDQIRLAADDNAYRAGVAALQTAMVNDPPAVFLTWRERARAVSRRFHVPPVAPGTDVFTTLRLWTPASTTGALSTN
jgi:peptide/nickel transport system substrate-binding protein